jgi:tetratricopeptide (TPR) repeat protein
LRSTERHQLKQDQFAAATMDKLSWAVEHRNPLLYAGLAIVVLLLIAVGAFYYQQSREQKASILLGDALLTYSSPLRPAGTPEIPGQTSYTNANDRAKAVAAKLNEVVDKYGRTDSGANAQYFLGLAAKDMGDNGKAEEHFKKVADFRNKDLSALGKSALAALYHETGRDQQSIELYKGLIDKPTNSVPKPQSQLALAEIYAPKDGAQARKILEEVAKENAGNPIGNLAMTRMTGLNK